MTVTVFPTSVTWSHYKIDNKKPSCCCVSKCSAVYLSVHSFKPKDRKGYVKQEGSGFSPKKLFSLIKNSRQDNRGISTLKDSENILRGGNVKKANILNSQFQSVFLCLSPLKLGQLCTKKIQNLFQENIPENITPYVPLCRKSKLT